MFGRYNKFTKMSNSDTLVFLGLVALGGYTVFNSFYYVEVGHYAIKFNKIFGLNSKIYREGYNFKFPYVENQIIYNVQSRQNEIHAQTANRDMQNIKLSVKVLFHPKVSKLHIIHTLLGKNYDQKVLPALCNEILRTVVAQFSATQLLSQRDQVSQKIKQLLSERCSHFYIIIDNLAITDLTFGKEYLIAIESKQVAQQEAERAKYEVEQAKQVKKSTIIKAEASAKSIQLVGQASNGNSCKFGSYEAYLNFRRIEYREKVAQVLATSRNKIMLNNQILSMNLPQTLLVALRSQDLTQKQN